MPTKQQLAGELAISRWVAASARLKAAKDCELQLRGEAIAAVFGVDALGVAGTHSQVRPGGSVLKLEIGRTAKVDQALIGAAEAQLRAVAGAGCLLADRLLKTTVRASVAELEKLPVPLRAIFAESITIVLESPTLKLVPAPE